jgi:hypothetical protein
MNKTKSYITKGSKLAIFSLKNVIIFLVSDFDAFMKSENVLEEILSMLTATVKDSQKCA